MENSKDIYSKGGEGNVEKEMDCGEFEKAMKQKESPSYATYIKMEAHIEECEDCRVIFNYEMEKALFPVLYPEVEEELDAIVKRGKKQVINKLKEMLNKNVEKEKEMDCGEFEKVLFEEERCPSPEIVAKMRKHARCCTDCRFLLKEKMVSNMLPPVPPEIVAKLDIIGKKVEQNVMKKLFGSAEENK